MRPIAPEDFPNWRDFYASDHSHFVGGPKTAEDAWWKFVQFLGHWTMTGFGYWSVATTDGAYLGRVGLEQAIGWPEAELGWSFLPSAVGNGYATEAAEAVLKRERKRLDLKSVVSFIHPDNIASIRVAERLGAKRDDATKAAYADHLVYRHPEVRA